MKKIAKIIIGSNFGDEGKGLMTDYFANEAKKLKKSCLVICHNGGCQKGHTVVSPDGIRHVYHHFGAGTMTGADTYLSEKYIVNPITFRKEIEELKRKRINTKTYVNKSSIITFPFDMMINQIVEEYRENEKHGSCGLGVFETIIRNETSKFNYTAYEFANIEDDYKSKILYTTIKKYVPERLNDLNVKGIPFKWIDIFNNIDLIIEHWIEDFKYMTNEIEFTDDSVIDKYEYIIFEGAQGLLLDQNNIEYKPHLTPSNTGIKNPMEIISISSFDIEVCYITRTYMTRHGAGQFYSECKKEDINSKIIDLTNVPNQYQDSIRYGYLDVGVLKERIENDCICYNIKKSLAITHYNEYQINLGHVKRIFDDYNIYLSDGMTRHEINKL